MLTGQIVAFVVIWGSTLPGGSYTPDFMLSETDLAATAIPAIALVQEGVLTRAQGDQLNQVSIHPDLEGRLAAAAALLQLPGLSVELVHWLSLRRLKLLEQLGRPLELLEESEAWLENHPHHRFSKALRRFVAYHFVSDTYGLESVDDEERLRVMNRLLGPLLWRDFIQTANDVSTFFLYVQLLESIRGQQRVLQFQEVTSHHARGELSDTVYRQRVWELEREEVLHLQEVLRPLRWVEDCMARYDATPFVPAADGPFMTEEVRREMEAHVQSSIEEKQRELFRKAMQIPFYYPLSVDAATPHMQWPHPSFLP